LFQRLIKLEDEISSKIKLGCERVGCRQSTAGLIKTFPACLLRHRLFSVCSRHFYDHMSRNDIIVEADLEWSGLRRPPHSRNVRGTRWVIGPRLMGMNFRDLVEFSVGKQDEQAALYKIPRRALRHGVSEAIP